MRVEDPSGQTWRVTRRWVPWRRRLKGWSDTLEPLGWLGDDPVSLVIFVVLGIPLLIIVAFAGLEFLLLLAVLPFAILGRVLFGRYWTIEARLGFDPGTRSLPAIGRRARWPSTRWPTPFATGTRPRTPSGSSLSPRAVTTRTRTARLRP